mmetsp:Transcript_2563/g.4765  ORF Transcript_2563/g.4765 Transcript_2563/m.4765 type:complete len:151 (-) Transcript_2563:244-696(-)
MADTSCLKTAEHIYTMKVGGKTVLFRAEVDAMDAMDAKDSPVEIKVTPKTWTTSVMFQMISSGSPTLCKGTNAKVSAPKNPKLGYGMGWGEEEMPNRRKFLPPLNSQVCRRFHQWPSNMPILVFWRETSSTQWMPSSLSWRMMAFTHSVF